MAEIIKEIDYQGLNKLRQRRNSRRKTLSKLSEELDRILSVIKTKTEMLKSLNTEYAVTEREIKNSQNEIFLINKKRAEIIAGAPLLHNKFEKAENQLTYLKSEQGNLIDRITTIKRGFNEASSAVSTLEGERRELSKRFEEQNTVKQRISDEISDALSEASFDREEIEPRLIELNNSFLELIGKRSDMQMRLSEKEVVLRGLVESIEDFEHQIEPLEQIKTLQGEIDSLKEITQKYQLIVKSFHSKMEELNEELTRKQEQYDVLVQTDEDRMKEIASLEKEVSDYDEAVTMRNTAQEKKDSKSKMIEQGLEDLMELFTNKTELEISLLMMDKKIKAIAELAESMG